MKSALYINTRELVLLGIIVVLGVTSTYLFFLQDHSAQPIASVSQIHECILRGSGELTPALERPKEFREASGLIVSQQDGVYWAHGDGTSKKPEQSIWAINADGVFVARHTVPKAAAELVDFEDLAHVFEPQNNSHYLYLAAIGDNDSTRDIKKIIRIVEPKIDSTQTYSETMAQQNEVTALEFRYESTSGISSFNAESLIVDPKTSDIYIVAKTLVTIEDNPNMAWVFKLPANSFESNQSITATARPVVAIPGNYTGSQRNGPTSADISSDGSAIAILNNNEIIYYQRDLEKTVEETLQGEPLCRVPIKSNKNEGITFSQGSTSLVINSESKKTGLEYFEIGEF